MSLYEGIDRLIVEHVRTTRQPVSPLYARSVHSEAERIAEITGRHAMRVIDGRLTALKKRGVIHYSRELRAWATGSQP